MPDINELRLGTDQCTRACWSETGVVSATGMGIVWYIETSYEVLLVDDVYSIEEDTFDVSISKD